MYIDYNDFNLSCLRATHFDGYAFPKMTQTHTRTVYDYEIEYFTTSKEGGIIVDGTFIPFENDTINIRKPGQVVAGVLPYSCYCLIVDITGDRERRLNFKNYGSAQNQQPLYDNEIIALLPNKIEKNTTKAGELIVEIYNAHHSNDIFTVKTLLYQLFLEMYNLSKTDDYKDNLAYPAPIKRAIIYMQNNYASEIKIENLASLVGYSINHFQALFKNYVGITPNNYLNTIRLEKAKYLLKMTNLPVAKIGELCGIFDAVYFSFVFKKHFNISAREYRNGEKI